VKLCKRKIGECEEERKVMAREDGIPMIYYLQSNSKSKSIGGTKKKNANAESIKK